MHACKRYSNYCYGHSDYVDGTVPPTGAVVVVEVIIIFNFGAWQKSVKALGMLFLKSKWR